METKLNGYYLFAKGKDIFFITDAKAKTEKLLRKMCQKLEVPDAPSVLDALRYNLRKATLETKELYNGRKYHDINGENFGGYGHFLDEEKDVIIDLREHKPPKYKVFSYNGKELLRYTLKGTFDGEEVDTRELLAYDHNINPSDIVVTIV